MAAQSVIIIVPGSLNPARVLNEGRPERALIVVGRDLTPLGLLQFEDLSRLLDKGIERFADAPLRAPTHRRVGAQTDIDEYDFGVMRLQRSGGTLRTLGPSMSLAFDGQLAGHPNVPLLYRECVPYGHPNLLKADYPGQECHDPEPEPHLIDGP